METEYQYEKNIRKQHCFGGTGLHKYTLMENLHLDDFVIVQTSGVRDGRVEMITQRGISIYSEGCYFFVKWCNVISKRTIKQKQNLWQKLKSKLK